MTRAASPTPARWGRRWRSVGGLWGRTGCWSPWIPMDICGNRGSTLPAPGNLPRKLAPLGYLVTNTSVPKDGWSWGGCSPGVHLPPPRLPKSTSEPCPVTRSRVSSWTFPKTFCASQTYGAWSSGTTPEGQERGGPECWRPRHGSSPHRLGSPAQREPVAQPSPAGVSGRAGMAERRGMGDMAGRGR